TPPSRGRAARRPDGPVQPATAAVPGPPYAPVRPEVSLARPVGVAVPGLCAPARPAGVAVPGLSPLARPASAPVRPGAVLLVSGRAILPGVGGSRPSAALDWHWIGGPIPGRGEGGWWCAAFAAAASSRPAAAVAPWVRPARAAAVCVGRGLAAPA